MTIYDFLGVTGKSQIASKYITEEIIRETCEKTNERKTLP